MKKFLGFFVFIFLFGLTISLGSDCKNILEKEPETETPTEVIVIKPTDIGFYEDFIYV